MKKFFLMIGFVFGYCPIGFTQLPCNPPDYALTTDVKTPWGSTVSDTYIWTGGTGLDYEPPTKDQIEAFNKNLSDDYGAGNAIYAGPPTYTYNCHGYAWHVSEGGQSQPAWIGACTSTAKNIYWTDGSYTAVTETNATKVTYSGDHSAVRLSSTWYQSKWNHYFIVKHKPNCVPPGYGSPNGYYKKSQLPVISGTTPICSVSPTFTASNWNPAYTWVGSKVSIESPDSATTTVSANGTGAGYVRVMSGSNILAHYDVWVGSPSFSLVINPYWIEPLTSSAVTLSYSGVLASQGIYQIDWTVDPSNATSVGSGLTGTKLTAKKLPNGTDYIDAYVYAKAYNNCGTYNIGEPFLVISSWSPSNVYPNPVNDVLSVEINATANKKAKGQTLTYDYDIRLYNGQGNLLRQTTTKDGIIQFNVSNLPNDIYYLHIYDGVYSTHEIQQVVVEH